MIRLEPLLLVAACLAAGSALAQNTYEVNIDRPGQDYSNFELRQSDPRLCQEACLDDRRCRAWTYVRSGVQGPAPRCWLKDAVPQSTPNGCCVSGVVRN